MCGWSNDSGAKIGREARAKIAPPGINQSFNHDFFLHLIPLFSPACQCATMTGLPLSTSHSLPHPPEKLQRRPPLPRRSTFPHPQWLPLSNLPPPCSQVWKRCQETKRFPPWNSLILTLCRCWSASLNEAWHGRSSRDCRQDCSGEEAAGRGTKRIHLIFSICLSCRGNRCTTHWSSRRRWGSVESLPGRWSCRWTDIFCCLFPDFNLPPKRSSSPSSH